MRHKLINLILPLILSSFLSPFSFAAKQSNIEKESYSLGVSIGSQIQKNFKQNQIDIDADAFARGVRDILSQHKLELSSGDMSKALTQLQQRTKQLQQQKIQLLAAEQADQLFADRGYPSEGNENAEIIVVEFLDYQCPHCKKMKPVIRQLLESDKNIRVVYRDLPLLGPTSIEAAKVVIAARQQGKYLDLHNALLEAKNPLSSEQIYELAEKTGIDLKKLKAEIRHPRTQQILKNNFNLADKLGIHATPSFIFGPSPQEKQVNKNDIFYISGNVPYKTIEKIINQYSKQ